MPLLYEQKPLESRQPSDASDILKTSHEKLHLRDELANHLTAGSLSRLMRTPNQNRSRRENII